MEIFNIRAYGETLEHFESLSCAKKKEWIKRYTNQTNDSLIDEFIKNFSKGKEECDECKKTKNVSKAISADQVKAVIKPSKDSGNGNRGNTKGRK